MLTSEKDLVSYVDRLAELGAVVSDDVKRAFARVRRHRFLEEWYRPEIDAPRATLSFEKHTFDRDHPTTEDLAEIYSNRALVTAVEGWRPTSSTSQPALVARMLESLDLAPGTSVLEIGTGTGYNAALLREIVGAEGSVCSIELQCDVAERARGYLDGEGYHDVIVLARDAYCGAVEAAPYDRIVATVGCSDISPHWLEQLAPDGWMLIPLQHGFWDPLVRVSRDPDRAGHGIGRIVGYSGFMPIQGALGWRNPWQSYLPAGLPEAPTRTYPLPASLIADGSGEAQTVGDPRGRSYQFFLSLSTQLIQYPGLGFGIAEPAVGSVVLVNDEAIHGYAVHGHTRSLDNLHDRLVYLAEAWGELGRPSPEDYVLRFAPKTESPDIEGMSIRHWIVDRLDHLEIAELP